MNAQRLPFVFSFHPTFSFSRPYVRCRRARLVNTGISVVNRSMPHAAGKGKAAAIGQALNLIESYQVSRTYDTYEEIVDKLAQLLTPVPVAEMNSRTPRQLAIDLLEYVRCFYK